MTNSVRNQKGNVYGNNPGKEEAVVDIEIYGKSQQGGD
jgi:hypothetical protein